MKCKPALLLACISFLLCCCSTPKELEYRDFRNFTIQKISFASTKVRMELIYYNPNSFGLQLKQTELDIYLNGHYLGHTVQEHQVTMPRKMDFAIPIQVDADMKNLVKNGLTLLFNKTVTVKVTGKIKAGKANVFMNIPVNYEGQHSFVLF
ncbi:MAG TPA: LEA type 2 family protein [Ferruginibacter sp.]|nr:LEA type 2 family protein [Ferruginibacter sp.]HMP21951.1 LEA type 2 family protein [Ferruginibacter sp.]